MPKSGTVGSNKPLDPAEILSGKLFLGSVLVAKDRARLQANKITHVVNAAREISCSFADDDHAPGAPLTYLHLSLKDDADDANALVKEDAKEDGEKTAPATFPIFEKTNAFIDEACRPSKNGAVLVHCQAGISRSAMLVMAYLMHKQDASLKQAWEAVKEKRHNAGPNETFIRVLQRYEEHLWRQRHRTTDSTSDPEIEFVQSFSMQEYYTDTLVSMGFDRDTATQALEEAGGRFEVAVDICVVGAAETPS